MFNLSPPLFSFVFCPAHKSSDHKLSQNNNICPDTNGHKTYTNVKQIFFKVYNLDKKRITDEDYEPVLAIFQ